MHTFEWKAGSLYHYFNGQLLAVVAAEHVPVYRESVVEAPESEAATVVNFS